MNSLVSVIICTHNRRKLVPRAIDSALAQEDSEFEIIVIDDCSHDRTYEFLRECYEGRIKLISTEKNSGRAIATNLGYQQANGDYIALLDDDDYWFDEHKICKQVSEMENRPALGVLGTWWVEIESGGKKVEKKPVAPRNRYFLIERLLMGGGIVSGSSPLISRVAWDTVNGMDEKQVKGIDSDLYRRIALSGFDVDVIKEVTTVADVSHDFERMTSTKNVNGKLRQVQGNFRVLKTHFVTYFLYPRAFLFRMYKVVCAFLSWFRVRFLSAPPSA